MLTFDQLTRCTAPPDDLDGGDGILRSREYTESLRRLLDAKSLWDNYGIIDDVVVCIVIFYLKDYKTNANS